jgi:hypothetical protein
MSQLSVFITNGKCDLKTLLTALCAICPYKPRERREKIALGHLYFTNLGNQHEKTNLKNYSHCQKCM